MRYAIPVLPKAIAARLALILPLVLGAAACGTPADTPSDAVQRTFRLIDEGDLDGVLALTCEAERDTLRRQFDFSDLAGLLPGDPDLSPIFEALNLDTSGLDVTVVDEAGDTATVHLGGSLIYSFDAEQLRDILRAAVEGQGRQIDEEQLTTLITALGNSSQSLPLDQTIMMAREGGAWRICSRLTLIN